MFTFISDHLLLKTILKKDMRDCPPRLLPLVERTVLFNFETKFIKGARNLASDCLSRQVNYGQSIDVADEMVRRIVKDCAEQVQEDPLMSDILQRADQKYLQAVDAKRRNMEKVDVRKLSAEQGAKRYMSKWESISVLDNWLDTLLLLNMDRIIALWGSSVKGGGN